MAVAFFLLDYHIIQQGAKIRTDPNLVHAAVAMAADCLCALDMTGRSVRIRTNNIIYKYIYYIFGFSFWIVRARNFHRQGAPLV